MKNLISSGVEIIAGRYDIPWYVFMCVFIIVLAGAVGCSYYCSQMLVDIFYKKKYKKAKARLVGIKHGKVKDEGSDFLLYKLDGTFELIINDQVIVYKTLLGTAFTSWGFKRLIAASKKKKLREFYVHESDPEDVIENLTFFVLKLFIVFLLPFLLIVFLSAASIVKLIIKLLN